MFKFKRGDLAATKVKHNTEVPLVAVSMEGLLGRGEMKEGRWL
jgi:hypothetical protein